MGVFAMFGRRRRRYEAVTDEERISRYVYLLNTLPASVIERAHASAFRDVPVERRREMFAQLRPFMSDAEQSAAPDDPTVLAKLVRRAEERRAEREAGGGADAGAAVATETRADTDPRDGVDSRALLLSSGVAMVVSQQFLLSAAVMTYFTAGAGSVGIGAEPAWIGEAFDPGGGAFGGFSGAGDPGGGGGFDGGGFGGGFDGGGFGGDGGG